MRLFDRVFRFLFGDDIFVSYSRSDAATYAAGLANQLTSRRFTCKLDQWGSQPGKEIPPGLKAALRRSSVLVLVGTAGAARSAAVGQEIQEFRKTRRMIIPISFNGVIRSATWFPAIEGLHLSNENEAALETGDPSPEVVNRIEKSYTFSRKDQRLRAATVVTTVILAILVGAAGVAAAIAESARRDAVEQSRKAREQTALADEAKLDAGRQQAEAARQRGLAAEATIEAATQQKIASEQKRVATARQLLAQAELARNRGDDPYVLPVRLALEAWTHYPIPEVEPILRYGLDRLPRLIADFPHPKPLTAVAIHPDGRAVTTLCADRAVRVWQIGSRDPAVVLQLGDQTGPVVLGTDGKLIAVAEQRSARVYRISSEGALLLGRIEQAAPIKALALDHDAKHLAAAGDNLVITVWEIESGLKRSAEIRQDRAKGEVVRGLQFSGDGARLAVSTLIDVDEDDPKYPVSLWSLTDRKRLFQTSGRVALNSDGSLIASGSGDTFWLYRVGGEQPARVARVVEQQRVTALAFVEELLLAGSGDGVRIYDTRNDGKEIALLAHSESVDEVRIDAGSESPAITTLSNGKTVHQWVSDSNYSLNEGLRIPHTNNVDAFAVRGREIATATKDGHLRVWEKTYNGAVTGYENGQQPVEHSEASDMAGQARERLRAFLHKGDREVRASRSADGKRIEIRSGPKRTLSRSYVVPAKAVELVKSATDVALSPSGRYLFLSGEKTGACLLKFSDGAIQWKVPAVSVWHPVFSKDERYVAGHLDMTARVWDVPSGSLIMSATFGDDVLATEFSADGRKLFVARGQRADEVLIEPRDLVVEARARLASLDVDSPRNRVNAK